MNISSRHSKCTHHIVIHWSLIKVQIEIIQNDSHQRETICDKFIFFTKLVRQWKSKEWAKFELECLFVCLFFSDSFWRNNIFVRYWIRLSHLENIAVLKPPFFCCHSGADPGMGWLAPPPFGQLNHANSAYFEAILANFHSNFDTRAPSFLQILGPALPLKINYRNFGGGTCVGKFNFFDILNLNWIGDCNISGYIDESVMLSS